MYETSPLEDFSREELKVKPAKGKQILGVPDEEITD
jgi:hypothetical protein